MKNTFKQSEILVNPYKYGFKKFRINTDAGNILFFPSLHQH